jgi:hypothetical protein
MKNGRLMAMLATFAVLGGTFASTAAVSAQTPTPTATPTATATPTTTATPTAAPTFAPCPAGATLTVSPPTAAAPTTVTVAVSPANLNLRPGTAGDFSSFHLHYFIDTPATAAGAPVPTGNASIVHTDATTLNLGALAAGQHTVVVVLGQLSHVACDTRASVTFTVAQAATPTPTATAAAAPAAPKTGNAGLLGGDSSGLAVVSLLLGVTLLVVGGRTLMAAKAR